MTEIFFITKDPLCGGVATNLEARQAVTGGGRETRITALSLGAVSLTKRGVRHTWRRVWWGDAPKTRDCTSPPRALAIVASCKTVKR